ncbi:MAG: M24 family metallopeptidase [Gammaproteobacteria bacterium]
MTGATKQQKQKPPLRGFAKAEYAARLAKLQAAMTKRGWDGVLLTTAADICYMTGFLTPFFLSPTRPWFVVVPGRGMPVAVVPQIGAAAMRRCYVGEVRKWNSPNPQDEGISLLADTLAALTKTNGMIGSPLGAETYTRMPMADYDKLQKILHPRVFVDSADVLWQLRMQKSAAEVAKIRYVAAMMSDSFIALSQTEEGAVMSESQLCRALEIDVLRRGIDGVPYLVAASGGGGYETIMMPPTCRIVGRGEVLMIDVGAVYDGYFCDFCRNYAASSPPQEAANAHDVLYDSLQAGFAAARPDNTAADVWRAMEGVLSRAGFASAKSGGRFGHGIGLQLTEKPSLMPNDNTMLKAGMTLALEPSLTMANGLSIVREENIVIGENKTEWLTNPAPRVMLALR